MTFDLARTMLVAVVLVLTGLLLVVGFQVFSILREVKRAVRNINEKLEKKKAEGGFLGEISQVKSLLEEETQDGEEYPHIQTLQERGRRFFTKEGKPLG